MVASRVWVRCMKSAASSTVPQVAMEVRPNMFLRNTYSRGSIPTPNRVPMNRQPKGVMPNRRIPTPMISLPRGGWEIS